MLNESVWINSGFRLEIMKITFTFFFLKGAVELWK